ncbi:Mis18-binding protein 1 [Merluccius polli]|uniref:Mis18-binding protein 1 n=1 Tax=Merluccius polli TaxID=89951 RepID=A0AA47N7L1_MERPO|nr:Mis18-binding protein 1 [Merluccius polli]
MVFKLLMSENVLLIVLHRGSCAKSISPGHRVPSQKSSTSTAFDQEEIEYLPEREFPPNRFRSEDADDLFESSRKDEAPFPAPRPQMVLVEDPLVIHSPHLFFHKKHKSHFKPNPAPLEKSQPEQGSGYKLEQWTIKFHQQGLFVDGIRTLDNIPWHSTTIVERISNCVLKTLSGRTYTLIGKMIMDDDSTASCPPPTSNVSCFGMKTSRSGRVIKQPLEFWKGGRVSVDANMNVTIHDAYETTVCMTQSKKTDTVIASQLPKQHDGVFQVCSEAPQHSERTGMPVVDHKPSVLQRKVKTLSCNRKAKTHELPNDQIHSPEKDLLSNANSSLEEEPRRSKRQRLVSEAALQSVPRRREAPKRRSNSEGPESRNSGNAELPRKRNIPASKEPAVAHSSASSSDEDVPVRRTGSRKVHRKGMHQSVLNDSDDSWTVSGKDKKRSATGKAKSKGRPPPPAPASAPAQASKRGAQSTAPKRGVQQEEDEENWTEAELVRLKETVASFPKHMGSYWVNVARKVGTRSPEECQHMFQGSAKAPRKKAMASKKKEKEESTANQEPPKITARVGTLKRKQQVRQFIEAMPKEDHDDIFTSAAMQNRHFFGQHATRAKHHHATTAVAQPIYRHR